MKRQLDRTGEIDLTIACFQDVGGSQGSQFIFNGGALYDSICGAIDQILNGMAKNLQRMPRLGTDLTNCS